jgi:hypothetical protein
MLTLSPIPTVPFQQDDLKTTSPSSAFHGIQIRPSKRFSLQLLAVMFATAGGDPISDATATREVLKTFNPVS